MPQFLIVYRRSTGTLLDFVELGTDRSTATLRRFEREQTEKGDPDVEVVVLSAPNREALLRTHARYFKTFGELAADLSAALPS